MEPLLSSSLGKKILLPVLKILQKTFQNLRYVPRVCKGPDFGLKTIHFPPLSRFLLQRYSNMSIFFLYSPFPVLFYNPPDEYILLFYFLLSSLLSTSFFSVSFFSDFFLFYNFFTFLVHFLNCFPPNGPELRDLLHKKGL